MTTTEFSNEFDVLYSNIMSNQAPGLDEYEKSLLLTKAQLEILKNYFNPLSGGNMVKQGFDDSPKRQIDFSNITMLVNPVLDDTKKGFFHNVSSSHIYSFPDDILMILNEKIKVERRSKNPISELEVENIDLSVVPISMAEYDRVMSKPFKYPLKNQAWRLIHKIDNDRISEVIVGPNDVINNDAYQIRYLRRPNPIILIDLTNDDLSIEGISTVTECELDPELHPEILQRAVELAKVAYPVAPQEISSSLQTGVRSE